MIINISINQKQNTVVRPDSAILQLTRNLIQLPGLFCELEIALREVPTSVSCGEFLYKKRLAAQRCALFDFCSAVELANKRLESLVRGCCKNSVKC